MKKSLFLLALLCLPLILAGCTKEHKIVVALDYTPNTNHTGMFVARAKDYYKDLELDVEFIQPDQSSAEQLVASNKADVAISFQENLLMAQEQGLDLEAIYAIQAHNTSGFVSLKDKNITTAKDFDNKSYCGFGGAVEEEIVKELNKKDGGNPDSIKFIRGDNNIMNIKESECDIYWEFESWGIEQLDLAKIPYNYISLKDNGYDWYTPIIITKGSSLKNDKKDILTKFIEGTKKGYLESSKNPEEAANILLKDNPELDKELIQASQKRISTMYFDTEATIGQFNPDIYNKFTDFLIEKKIVGKGIKDKETYTNDLVK